MLSLAKTFGLCSFAVMFAGQNIFAKEACYFNRSLACPSYCCVNGSNVRMEYCCPNCSLSRNEEVRMSSDCVDLSNFVSGAAICVGFFVFVFVSGLLCKFCLDWSCIACESKNYDQESLSGTRRISDALYMLHQHQPLLSLPSEPMTMTPPSGRPMMMQDVQPMVIRQGGPMIIQQRQPMTTPLVTSQTNEPIDSDVSMSSAADPPPPYSV